MDKFIKVAGVVVLAWIALGIVGWVFHFLITAVFWVALVAGGIWLVSAVSGRKKEAVNGRGSRPTIR